MEKQISDSRENGESILILGDLNCKVGRIIEGNRDEISKGGKVLLKMIKKYKMKLLNADPCCEGRWTRIEGQSKSILDYAIVFEEDVQLMQSLKIDEEKDITPYYTEKVDGEVTRMYTDHCMINLKMDIQVKGEKGKTYTTVMDEEGEERFREKLGKENVSGLLTGNILQTYPIWEKKVLDIRDQCTARSRDPTA